MRKSTTYRKIAARPFLAAVLLLLVLVIVGCGSKEGQVRDAVESYLSALADGDGEKACEQLNGETKRQIADATGESTCADAVARLGKDLGSDEKSKLKDAEVVNVKVKDIKRECSKL